MLYVNYRQGERTLHDMERALFPLADNAKIQLIIVQCPL